MNSTVILYAAAQNAIIPFDVTSKDKEMKVKLNKKTINLTFYFERGSYFVYFIYQSFLEIRMDAKCIVAATPKARLKITLLLEEATYYLHYIRIQYANYFRF